MVAADRLFDHVYETLKDLKGGQVYGPASNLAKHYGVTVQTIYRWARRRGLRWRKEKATKGSSRLSRDIVMKAAALIYATRRTNNQILLPACDAKEILEDSGILTNVSTSWFLARLRQEKVSAGHIAAPTPHVRLLSDHPNHVWQFDVTNCTQYYLDEEGMGERDEALELSKNKIVKTAQSMRRQLLRYVVVDHCTGAFYFRYFYAPGECVRDGATFLFEAMRQKDELIKRYFPNDAERLQNKFPFHGVPFKLIADKGSMAVARANLALFAALRIELHTHLPGNPRAKGAVEGTMHLINRFEARLKFVRPASLDELNRHALDWTIMFSGTKKMRQVASRSALWLTITKEQLRICPDEKRYRLLMREPVIKRRADGSSYISVDGYSYHIPDPQASNQWVEAVRHPFEYPAVEVHFNGFVWLCQPIKLDHYGRLPDGVRYGEYRLLKETPVQQARKEMEQIASSEWSLSFKGTGDKRHSEAPLLGHVQSLKVFGHQADKVTAGFISRSGTPLDVKHPESPSNPPIANDENNAKRSGISRYISIADLILHIKDEIGPVSKDLNKALRAAYGGYMDDDEARDVIEQMKKGTWPRVAAGLTAEQT